MPKNSHQKFKKEHTVFHESKNWIWKSGAESHGKQFVTQLQEIAPAARNTLIAINACGASLEDLKGSSIHHCEDVIERSVLQHQIDLVDNLPPSAYPVAMFRRKNLLESVVFCTSYITNFVVLCISFNNDIMNITSRPHPV